MKLEKFASRGKLMLTGEYIALNGASVIGWPTVLESTLLVESTDSPNDFIIWQAFDESNLIWFEANINTTHWTINETSNIEIAERLVRLLSISISFNPSKELSLVSKVKTYSGWKLEWGLGSSSTLLANVAQWFDLPAWRLHAAYSKGSGYDVACALNDHPIIFRCVKDHPFSVESIELNEVFYTQLLFGYLGHKQSSDEAIAIYHNIDKPDSDIQNTINAIDQINFELMKVDKIRPLMDLFDRHEDIISSLTGKPRVGNQHFQSFDGVVKSLGAWGGDFVVFASEQPYSDTQKQILDDYGITTFVARNFLV